MTGRGKGGDGRAEEKRATSPETIRRSGFANQFRYAESRFVHGDKRKFLG